jgi:hypothetical protein
LFVVLGRVRRHDEWRPDEFVISVFKRIFFFFFFLNCILIVSLCVAVPMMNMPGGQMMMPRGNVMPNMMPAGPPQGGQPMHPMGHQSTEPPRDSGYYIFAVIGAVSSCV